MLIRKYEHQDEKQVIRLWNDCGLLRPWNDPQKDIERKTRFQPDFFYVGTVEENQIIASAMAGYDGHRGWIYYFAVHPDFQRRSYGKQMMEHVEKALKLSGCPKINLQIREDNLKAGSFYETLGYKADKVLGFGKRLIKD